MHPRRLVFLTVLAIGVVAAAPVSAANINSQNSYTVHALQSDNGVDGSTVDTSLVNGWGIAALPTSPWWVADNGTDKSTLYTGAGAKVAITVNVPGGPTGIVANAAGTGFVVSGGGRSGSARFIFATEAGEIRGWNPTVPTGPTPPSSESELGSASDDGAIYKGLAIGTSGGNQYLYAADFHNGVVEVYDSTFAEQDGDGAFVDPGIPAGFAPFGIQNLNGMIFVTYAKQDADAEDEIAGEGLGYVSAFGTDGSFLGRVASGGALNAPWGLAWAPLTDGHGHPGFGKFSGDLLVGNFGDGRINAFAWTGSGWEARGHLKTANHHPLSIDGLWGIGFGNGSGSGPITTLYFAAGPDDESHGLYGSVTSNN
jgi:uncharacterized protein (TIGR03118 family)